MCPGEALPDTDRRKKLPQDQQQHERGEQEHQPPSHCRSGRQRSRSNDLFEQELLHISESDLVSADGRPRSPCPSTAVLSPDPCPVRLQEVNLNSAQFAK